MYSDVHDSQIFHLPRIDVRQVSSRSMRRSQMHCPQCFEPTTSLCPSLPVRLCLPNLLFVVGPCRAEMQPLSVAQ